MESTKSMSGMPSGELSFRSVGSVGSLTSFSSRQTVIHDNPARSASIRIESPRSCLFNLISTDIVISPSSTMSDSRSVLTRLRDVNDQYFAITIERRNRMSDTMDLPEIAG